MSLSPSKNSHTASPTFSFPAPLPLRPQLMSIYKAEVSVKLDEENFLIWRLLVEPVIKVWIEEKKKKVQNNNESDESDRQSLNGNIYSGQQPIPPLPLTNSFLQQYPPNAALLAAAAAASDSQYLPPAWTSPPTFCSYHASHINNMRPSNLMTMPPHSPHPQPQPQPPQPPLPPSYSSAWSYSQSNY
ncbi:hypothetical protein P8452_38359 [Trifolium repens]|nr:hypothetical protein P8452_38359 [Trifolium repens]